MIVSDRELINAYLVNEGLRIDSDLVQARYSYHARPCSRTAAALFAAHMRKEDFKKFSHDLAALLNI